MPAVCLSVKNNGAFLMMLNNVNKTVRVDPRLSVNKLGEYLVAKAKRRQKILSDAKYPKSFIAPRFGDFYRFFENGVNEEKIDAKALDIAISILQNKPTTSDWQSQNKDLSLDLLAHLKVMVDSMGLNRYAIKKITQKDAAVDIRGVKVSIRPELMIEAEKKGKRVIGAVKLNVTKSFPLNDDSGQYIATMVRNYLEGLAIKDAVVDPALCFVVDLPHERFFKAPTAFKQRTWDIEAACDEIKAVWPTIF